MKRKTVEPVTFHDRLVAHEHERHARRLADIKKAASKIAMFERDYAALELINSAPGTHSSIACYRHSLDLSRGLLTESEAPLYRGLLAIGYIEVSRDHPDGAHSMITLKKGRLRVQLFMRTKDMVPVQTSAQPSGEPL